MADEKNMNISNSKGPEEEKDKVGTSQTSEPFLTNNNFTNNYQLHESEVKSVEIETERGKRKLLGTDINVPFLVKKLASKEAREDILSREKAKEEADSELIAFYREVEAVPKDQNLPPNLISKYFDVKRDTYLADFNFHLSIIRNVFFSDSTPQESKDQKVLEGLKEKDLEETKQKGLKKLEEEVPMNKKPKENDENSGFA